MGKVQYPSPNHGGPGGAVFAMATLLWCVVAIVVMGVVKVGFIWFS